MTINCKGKLVDLSSPKVMGILNLTPDSFYDGGKYKNEKEVLLQVEKMVEEGATFIDVGGYSSRPGAKHISEEEELKRVVATVSSILAEFPGILISIDTFRSRVAEETIRAGAAIINDISGGEMDENMFKKVAELQVPYILMHMQGVPQSMQSNPNYNDIVKELIFYFSDKISRLRELQVKDVVIDVGFGFGKTLENNYELLKKLALFSNLEAPILTGVSRKSMLYKPLEITAIEALNATTVANTIALLNGTNILRVHDVKPAVEAIKVVSYL
ncbi:dihydropteroate synthase [Tenacibaculum sp. C7A-26P2]|uniref:dihydropteroate synthase n=1 Tax=Tenacibaculum sp. C7A-26P2 TaxID=3447504 RepID=UPI003F848790